MVSVVVFRDLHVFKSHTPNDYCGGVKQFTRLSHKQETTGAAPVSASILRKPTASFLLHVFKGLYIKRLPTI